MLWGLRWSLVVERDIILDCIPAGITRVRADGLQCFGRSSKIQLGSLSYSVDTLFAHI